MKIKSIAQLCKRSKHIILFDKKQGDFVRQWIGDGGALYPVDGLPYLEAESVFTIFDILEKQREKIHFSNSDAPGEYNYEDICESENIINDRYMSIVSADRVLMPLQTQKGITFIDTRYLAPLSDVFETLELYERVTRGGQIYIAAKAGFMLMAIILPVNIISEEFVHKLSEVTRLCKVSLESNNYEHREL